MPGDPSKPFENEAMANAAKTWDDKYKYWENGGGGTVWNTLSADPNLNLLYFGTGNAGPWASSIRNPSGKDNLYTSSVVALDLDTGKYAWHFQETPADTWDYDADQDLILTDLTIDGQTRPVLLHAAKNGFFYVLDRKTGQFISAKNFVDVNWASGYTADGRPIEIPGARGTDKPIERGSGAVRRAQLAIDVVQPEDRPRLYSGPERSFGHGRRPQLEPGQRRHRPADERHRLESRQAARGVDKASLLAGSSPGTRFARRRPGRRTTLLRGTAARSRPRAASSSRARRTGDSSPTTRRAAKSCGTPRSAAASSRPR